MSLFLYAIRNGGLSAPKRLLCFVGKAIQEVVVVIEPGPLKGNLNRWKATVRMESEDNVIKATEQWKAHFGKDYKI